MTTDAHTRYVAKLPRRTAHAMHALIETCKELGSPAKANEVVIYDEQAMDARGTANALTHAMRLGLAVYTGPSSRLWVPTLLAMDLRSALEDRYLRETGEPGDE